MIPAILRFPEGRFNLSRVGGDDPHFFVVDINRVQFVPRMRG